MPPRSITLAIVAFWLAATSWLFYRDIWPTLLPGERPPFTIDLSRESFGAKAGTHWMLHRNGQRIGSANSMIRYVRADDNYELTNTIHFEKFKFAVLNIEFEVRRMKSVYRVTQDGDLVSVHAIVDLYWRANGVDTLVQIQVKGHVEDGMFHSQWSTKSPGVQSILANQEFSPDPIEVHSHSSMLNPMMPWSRLLNVREKQTWRMALFDPLADSLSSMVPGKKPTVRYLDAGVKEGTDELFWDGRNTACLVIEYHDRKDDMTAKTWVRQSDGLVLRQEAVRPGNHLTLEREPK